MTMATEAIGTRIALYRRLAGLTAETLAAQVGTGMTRSVIANIESGRKADISVAQLLAISEVLGISPIALMLPLENPSSRISLREGRREYELGEVLEWVLMRKTSYSSERALGTHESRYVQRIAKAIAEKYDLEHERLSAKPSERPGIDEKLSEVEDDLVTLTSALRNGI